MTNGLLMIAYHYPPCGASSGLQRALSFSRHLPAYNWHPIVLTAHSRAYPAVRHDQMSDIPQGIPVKRALAFDTARHLSFRGHYFRWMAFPDRWVSWWLGAIPMGLSMIRTYRPKILWSTYPLATSHLIALTLHRLTGLPWVADFRDPMTEVDAITGQLYPTDPGLWRMRRWIERKTIEHSSRVVLVTPGSLQIHRERYSQVPNDRWAVIGNGYDEDSFAAAETIITERGLVRREPLVLLHSGTLYPAEDRDPSAFFAAIADLRDRGEVSGQTLRVILRASGYDDRYARLIREKRLDEIITLAPAIPYREALAEMLMADGLLVFQGYTSNPAVPAKLYEYLRAKRPIFALVDDEGDTAAVLRAARVGTLVPLGSKDQIAAGLTEFIGQVRANQAPTASDREIRSHSRQARARELAELLNKL